METSLEQILNTFTEGVLASLASQDMSGEQRELVRELLADQIDRRILSLIFDELPDEEFQALLDKTEGKELSREEELSIMSEAIDRIPEFGDKLLAVLDELRDDFVKDMVELKTSSSDNESNASQL